MPNIISIITVFYPDVVRLNKVVESISKQSKLIIVFNSPIPKSMHIPEDASIIVNETNLGIAKALNQAFFLANEMSYDYGFVLDQDSIPSWNAIEKLKYIIFDQELAIVGLSIVEEGDENELLNTDTLREVNIVITSGSLINIRILISLGYFVDEFFIDKVDTEYCLRLKKYNYRIYQTYSAYIDHEFGAKTKVKKTILIRLIEKVIKKNITHRFNYDSFRLYYQFRNEVWFLKLYNKSVYNNRLSLIKIIIRYVFIENNTLSKSISVLRGINDGFFTNPQNFIK